MENLQVLKQNTFSDAVSVTSSLAPSAMDSDDLEDTDTLDDDTIEEESVVAMPTNSAREPAPAASPSSPAPPATATTPLTPATGPAAAPLGSSLSLSTMSQYSTDGHQASSTPARRGGLEPSRFGGASFFKNLRKKKDDPPSASGGAVTSPRSPDADVSAVGDGRLRRYSEAPISNPIVGRPGAPPSPPTPRARGPPGGGVESAPRLGGAGSTSLVPRVAPSNASSRRSKRHSSSLPRGMRRVIIRGVSPRTMQALLFYLYTNQVHFVSIPHIPPHGQLNELHDEALEHLGNGSKQNPALWPPAFSNKSAYCLGKQLDLPDLMLRAFEHISLNLSTRSVLADLLSPFGDRFSDVQRVHLDYITRHWEEVKTRPDFVPIVENLAHGQYPKSSASLFQLFSKLSMSH
ncbi:unnamed protein product [Malassezia sympodialis ATCC 42132]|nr:uncharacterized protein MSY001_2934 [Malassezia sympodialis ATCC 42132]CCV00229.1 unnamed protein product [Malassezia sympodialis ATCC 42132]|eukprot:XP_018741435.1 uncharacterized protein MSY001_2934 [Malassezia sympodialis ATCC 42132]